MRPDVNNLQAEEKKPNCQHIIPSQGEKKVYNIGPDLYLAFQPHNIPNLGSSRKDMFRVLVEPDEAHQPGLETVSRVYPVQTSWKVAWAPLAYCWLAFRYSFCIGKRQTSSPPCSPAWAETSSSSSHQHSWKLWGSTCASRVCKRGQVWCR
jgi:hypothetical protein